MRRAVSPSCFAVATLATIALSASDVAAQSLNDVAQREQARRKTVQSPGKVYTNENLSSDSGRAPVSAPASTPATAAAPAVKSPESGAGAATGAKPADGKDAAASAGAKDQAYWAKRMADARTSVERSKTFAEALQTRISALTADFAARSDPAQRAQIGADRQKALAELERVRKDIEVGTKAIETIQDEARKSGVPAGWVR